MAATQIPSSESPDVLRLATIDKTKKKAGVRDEARRCANALRVGAMELLRCDSALQKRHAGKARSIIVACAKEVVAADEIHVPPEVRTVVAERACAESLHTLLTLWHNDNGVFYSARDMVVGGVPEDIAVKVQRIQYRTVVAFAVPHKGHLAHCLCEVEGLEAASATLFAGRGGPLLDEPGCTDAARVEALLEGTQIIAKVCRAVAAVARAHRTATASPPTSTKCFGKLFEEYPNLRPFLHGDNADASPLERDTVLALEELFERPGAWKSCFTHALIDAGPPLAQYAPGTLALAADNDDEEELLADLGFWEPASADTFPIPNVVDPEHRVAVKTFAADYAGKRNAARRAAQDAAELAAALPPTAAVEAHKEPLFARFAVSLARPKQPEMLRAVCRVVAENHSAVAVTSAALRASFPDALVSQAETFLTVATSGSAFVQGVFHDGPDMRHAALFLLREGHTSASDLLLSKTTTLGSVGYRPPAGAPQIAALEERYARVVQAALLEEERMTTAENMDMDAYLTALPPAGRIDVAATVDAYARTATLAEAASVPCLLQCGRPFAAGRKAIALPCCAKLVHVACPDETGTAGGNPFASDLGFAALLAKHTQWPIACPNCRQTLDRVVQLGSSVADAASEASLTVQEAEALGVEAGVPSEAWHLAGRHLRRAGVSLNTIATVPTRQLAALLGWAYGDVRVQDVQRAAVAQTHSAAASQNHFQLLGEEIRVGIVRDDNFEGAERDDAICNDGAEDPVCWLHPLDAAGVARRIKVNALSAVVKPDPPARFGVASVPRGVVSLSRRLADAAGSKEGDRVALSRHPSTLRVCRVLSSALCVARGVELPASAQLSRGEGEREIVTLFSDRDSAMARPVHALVVGYHASSEHAVHVSEEVAADLGMDMAGVSPWVVVDRGVGAPPTAEGLTVTVLAKTEGVKMLSQVTVRGVPSPAEKQPTAQADTTVTAGTRVVRTRRGTLPRNQPLRQQRLDGTPLAKLVPTAPPSATTTPEMESGERSPAVDVGGGDGEASGGTSAAVGVLEDPDSSDLSAATETEAASTASSWTGASVSKAEETTTTRRPETDALMLALTHRGVLRAHDVVTVQMPDGGSVTVLVTEVLGASGIPVPEHSACVFAGHASDLPCAIEHDDGSTWTVVDSLAPPSPPPGTPPAIGTTVTADVCVDQPHFIRLPKATGPDQRVRVSIDYSGVGDVEAFASFASTPDLFRQALRVYPGCGADVPPGSGAEVALSPVAFLTLAVRAQQPTRGASAAVHLTPVTHASTPTTPPTGVVDGATAATADAPSAHLAAAVAPPVQHHQASTLAGQAAGTGARRSRLLALAGDGSGAPDALQSGGPAAPQEGVAPPEDFHLRWDTLGWDRMPTLPLHEQRGRVSVPSAAAQRHVGMILRGECPFAWDAAAHGTAKTVQMHYSMDAPRVGAYFPGLGRRM